MAGVFDHGELQAIAQAQIGDAVLAGVANGRNHALGPSGAKGPGDDDAVEGIELG